MKKNRHSSLDETQFKVHEVNGIKFYTSRIGFEGASLVEYRFPHWGKKKIGSEIVLIHGIGVSSRAYGPTAAMLAEHADVHLIDLAGYGRAPRPDGDFSIADHAELVSGYLRKKKLVRPVIVGHSMGTQVVAQLAATHPEQVGNIVLLAPVMPPFARKLHRAVALMAKDSLLESPLMGIVACSDYLFRSGLPYCISQVPHLLNMPIDEVVQKIQAKTLVVCGLKDPVSPPSWGRKLTKLLPNGFFSTVKGPHGAMWVTPKRLTFLILKHANR